MNIWRYLANFGWQVDAPRSELKTHNRFNVTVGTVWQGWIGEEQGLWITWVNSQGEALIQTSIEGGLNLSQKWSRDFRLGRILQLLQ